MSTEPSSSPSSAAAAAAAAETDADTQASSRAAPAPKNVEEEKELKEASSSSSSSTSSEDIDDDDFFQIEGPLLGIGTQLSPQQLGSAPAAEGSSSPHADDQSHAAATDDDPKQPPPAAAADERPDPKRIPSSVFARSRSTTPAEWSVTSNESLFSINVGNASFSKDHLFLYGKTSGELGGNVLNNPLAPLPPLPRQSPSPGSASASPIRGEVAVAQKPAAGQGQGGAAAAAAAVVKKAGAGDAEQENADYIHSLSHRSDGSTTSFAFPILAAGDARSSGSLKDGHSELARQSTAQMKERADKEQETTLRAAMQAPKPVEPPATTPAPVPVAAALAPPPPPPAATTKWFPWCSCCPFCC